MRKLPLSGVRAMLVTAGLGTRLAPLTDVLPKPAVPIANRPAGFYALDHLARAGVRDVVLNTHHLASELEAHLRSAAPPSLRLRFVHEPQILGTGGGIRNAWIPQGDETFVVMNGKIIFAPDLAAAFAQHTQTGAFATMIVKRVPPTDPTGVVFVDDEGQVRGLPGAEAAITAGLRSCMYTGVSLLSAAAHAQLPERGCLVRDGYATWIQRGARVFAHVDVGEFRDVGMSLWHYLEANLALVDGRDGRVRWPGIDPSPGIGLCDASARLGAGVSLSHSVVGPHARVDAGVRLERCVVWSGAEVLGSHKDAIILPDGRVVDVPAPPPGTPAWR